MKYKLFRSFGRLDKDVTKHELVAVEFGSDIDSVADVLIRDVADDLAEMEEYAGCETYAYAPKLVEDWQRVKRYRYEIQGVVAPPNASKNILIDFGIMEEET